MRIALLFSIPAALFAQTTGLVEGTITNKLTHGGAAGVTIRVIGGGREYSTPTSDSGTFRIPNVVEGDYATNLESHDYMVPQNGPRIRVSSGTPVRIEMELSPWAKIRGKVLDDKGKPVARAQVGMIR